MKNGPKDISIDQPILVWKNIPLDKRTFTKSLAEIDEFINYPYVGMVFYSQYEDNYYRVLSVCDGYKNLVTNQVFREERNQYRRIPGYFVDKFEEYTLKGNLASSIVNAYVNEEYHLIIEYYNGESKDAGYVRGTSGYSPFIKENIANVINQIYKLDIKYFDDELKEYKEFTTPNLRGDDGYSIKIIDTLDSIDDLENVSKVMGEGYIVDGYLWIYYNTKENNEKNKFGFKNVGRIRGNTGPKGRGIQDIKINSSGFLSILYDDSEIYEILGQVIFTPKIEENKDNNETVYKLDISYKDSEGRSYSFTTPNLRGNDGTSIKIIGSKESTDELLDIQNSELGDCYIIDGYLWVFSNSTKEGSINGFINAGKIQGPKGNGIQNIVGNYNNKGKLLSFTFVYDNGDMKKIDVGDINGADGADGRDGLSAYEIAVKNGFLGNEQQWLESLKGADGQKGDNGENGSDGQSAYELAVEKGFVGTEEEWLESLKGADGKDGQDGQNGEDGQRGADGQSAYEIAIKNGFVGTEQQWLESLKGADGQDGQNGSDGADGDEIELRVENNIIQWKYVTSNNWIDLISVDSIKGNNGKSIEFGNVTSKSIESSETPSVNISLNNILSDNEKNVYDIEFSIPKGEKGTDGVNGQDGQDGVDGREIELQSTESMIQWKYVGDIDWNDLISIESITGPQGEPGLDSEVSITENPDNTDGIYKLDISYTSKGKEVSFTTPNLKGGLNNLYEILETLPETDTEGTLDTNHIYMVLKNGVVGITSKEANYDKYIILNIAEDKTITWEKIETTEASGNILVLINGDEKTEATLPDIEFASTNFIYCLLTPEYQRGLNIGLTNDSNSNKNFYEEWIVIETETEKKWELLTPQIYRISASMIDYIWKFENKFTVYDDWNIASDIPEYQKKNYGDATPLNNFIFRLVPNGSTYNLILVKEFSGGKINKLSIAPQYKVKLNGTTYTCTVTELDGTYDENYTYYESDAEGNVSIKTYTEEEFGTQSVFSGVEVYSVYVADTVKKITRGFLYTSNMSAYHIPYDLEIIGDYAFYNTKSPTVQFEKLINNGKDVEAYPLEESKVKAIGVHAFDGNSNLAFLIRNEDGTTKDSNIVKTPATLKKIGDYAFYNTRIATLDTNLSSNLYIGDHAFVQCVHGGQTLSPTTYYTDATFLGVNGLTHDTINYSSAGVSNWFEGQEHAGHNYNFDSGHETDVLHVTLTSVDPDWSLQ